MAEKRTTYKIQDLGGIGEVHIADEVVAIVAGLAATDVDGVASMAGLEVADVNIHIASVDMENEKGK